MARERGRHSARLTCPLCREPLEAVRELHTCGGCRTDYHEVCLHELGGCSTLGCPLAGRGPAPQRGGKGYRRGRPRMRPTDRLRRERDRRVQQIAGAVLGALGLGLLVFLLQSETAPEDILAVLLVYGAFVGSVLYGLSNDGWPE